MDYNKIEKRQNTAKSFVLAYQRCSIMQPNSNGTFTAPLVPAVVCLAFAAEVFLKAIILADGNQSRGHKLKDLFDCLSTSSASQIADEITQNSPSDDFISSLESVSNTFVEWRYTYEATELSANIAFLEGLVYTLDKHLDVRLQEMKHE